MNLAQRMALYELFARLGVVTWLDGFCGGGGSSIGIHEIPGQVVRIAINHWRPAINIHEANHQNTDHDCADMSQVDPWRYPRTDCAWFSPSCTKHSIAQGKKRPKSSEDPGERSRATMWDVQRFAEVHRYRFIIVENVIEVRNWWAFRAWKIAMEDTGYCLHEVSLNAAHAGALGNAANQSRDRWFCMLHLKGTRCPDTQRWLSPQAHCENCGTVQGRQTWNIDKKTKLPKEAGKYRQQYRYTCPACGSVVVPFSRPARELIDWSLPIPAISTRPRTADKPEGLADATMERIRHGLRTYGTALVPCEGRDGKKPLSLDAPHRTVTTRNETGLLVPYYGNGIARPVSEPSMTVTGVDTAGLLVPAGGTWNDTAYLTDQPSRTVMTRETTALCVAPPFMTELKGGSSKTRRLSDPLSTVHASGNHHGITVPSLEAIPDDLYSPAGREYVQACGFRMLEPFEYARFQAFPDTYDWFPDVFNRPLSKRHRVRMIGNAVPPNMARDLVGCALESMAA
ncbi:DNA cytosine methyltransferase [Streptomyces sp. NPDC046925]|uniref:DNA cytosine methyltransferase n=1 Tax=Streptomyces sp. NPDC046925 TaxID=3155375 RepID=UPI0033DAF70B